ncbi:MAG: DUF3078 domain-containing protein [Prevotella sp.]|nr:DUF3078 domain-containing protein [Candidatus Prevotella equi]
MNKYFYLIALALSLTLNASAQRNTKQTKKTPSPSAIVTQAYSDSLVLYRKQIDSLMAANDSLRNANGYNANSGTYRLFAPTAYYSGIANNLFSMGKKTNEEDAALMNLYMKRPDLVAYSADKLSKAKDNSGAPLNSEPEKMQLAEQASAAAVAAKTAPQAIANDTIDLFIKKPNFWKFNGDYYLQFMQNYVTANWYKSGSNSYSMLGSVTLQYNYNNKQKVKWDNKLEMKLGFMTSESDTVNKFKSSEDLIRYTSKLGIQAHKNWYYTAQLIANTQFTKGYKNNNKKVFSDFMSPFNLNVSLGMDYNMDFFKGKLKGNVHLAPIAYNLKYVDRVDLAESFGIAKNHHSLNDYGSQVTVDMVYTPWDFFKWQMRMYAYTTYHKFEFECENTFTFKFNKYLSANLFLYPRFDDSVKRKDDSSLWQFKEYLSVGFSYSM